MPDAGFVPLLLAALAAALVGFSKTGVVGMGILIVPLMASVFEVRQSTGALLPMLIVADLFSVVYFRRHAQWRLLARLLPWVMPGIVIGWLTLGALTGRQLGPVLGGMVLVLMGLNACKERRAAWLEEHLPRAWWFSAAMGFLAGFATMVGNVAGPVMSLYLISMGLRKREFMGTGAWYYLIVNTIKIPFSANLGLITRESLAFNAMATPIIALGALVGILVFNEIPQRWFNRIVLGLAALASARLILSG